MEASKDMLVSNLEEAFPSYNNIFKRRLRWSPGLQEVFQRGISADNLLGVHEYRNVIRQNLKGEWNERVLLQKF